MTEGSAGDVSPEIPDDLAGLDGLESFGEEPGADVGPGAEAGDELTTALAEVAERTEDLQRLQAEYVNYRKRVDRDRAVAREQAIVAMVEAMIPVLDDLDSARAHGDLADGTPFASIAEKLESALARFDWTRYGADGEVFDPNVHDALMHSHADDATETTVSAVLQSGHRVGERVVRAARVAVVGPPE